jgi:hypothetical protein
VSHCFLQNWCQFIVFKRPLLSEFKYDLLSCQNIRTFSYMDFGIDRLFAVMYDHLGRRSSTFEGIKMYFAGPRSRSAAARLLRLWVRIPPGAWTLSLVSVVCCEVEFSATS